MWFKLLSLPWITKLGSLRKSENMKMFSENKWKPFTLFHGRNNTIPTAERGADRYWIRPRDIRMFANRRTTDVQIVAVPSSQCQPRMHWIVHRDCDENNQCTEIKANRTRTGRGRRPWPRRPPRHIATRNDWRMCLFPGHSAVHSIQSLQSENI